MKIYESRNRPLKILLRLTKNYSGFPWNLVLFLLGSVIIAENFVLFHFFRPLLLMMIFECFAKLCHFEFSECEIKPCQIPSFFPNDILYLILDVAVEIFFLVYFFYMFFHFLRIWCVSHTQQPICRHQIVDLD